MCDPCQKTTDHDPAAAGGGPEPCLWCVIPVYNNAASAPAVVRACRETIRRVLVVDDGSSDADLRRVLRDLDVAVIRHERNRGKGAALLTACDYLLRHGATHMLTFDGDGQHLPDDIPRLRAAALADPGAVVIGCRDFNTPNVPRSSRFGRRFSNFWVRVETGTALHDTQSGLRVYPLQLLSQLRLDGLRYDFEIDVLVRSVWAGAKVREIPVNVRYPPPCERVSHFRPLVDNLRLSRMHARLVGRRLLPWPHQRIVAGSRPSDPWILLRQPVHTLKQMLGENATPSGLAAAAAVGSLLAVLPLVGLHMIIILYVTARLHLNKVMALAIQNLYMPPLTPFLCIQIGFYMRHGRWWTRFTREMVIDNFHQRLLEWLLGSLVLAPILAVLAGAITFLAAYALQRRMQPLPGKETE